MLRYSLLLVGGLAHVVAGACFWFCRRPYRAAVSRLAAEQAMQPR